jgi:hypothetical protein
MWSQIQTQASSPKPLILVGPEWAAIFNHFITELDPYIAPEHTRYLTFAPDVKAAFRQLKIRINSAG